MKTVKIYNSSYYFYLKVQFHNTNKDYFYLSTDLTIKAGDRVAVMTNEGVKEVRVISTGFYLENNVPYPIHLTSEIISKIHKSSNDEVVSDQKFYFQSTSYDKEIIKQKPSESLFEIENGELKAIKETSSRTIYIPLNVRSIISLFKISTKVVGAGLDFESVNFIPQGYLKVSMLENLYIPSSVRFASISSSIKNLFLSDGIEEINIYNYHDLESSDADFNFNLKTIYIPKSLKIINVDWSQIQEVYIDPKNEYFKLSNGILYWKRSVHEQQSTYIKTKYNSINQNKIFNDTNCEYVMVWRDPQSKVLKFSENSIIERNWLISGQKLIILEGVKSISLNFNHIIEEINIPASLEVIETTIDSRRGSLQYLGKNLSTFVFSSNNSKEKSNNLLKCKSIILNPNNNHFSLINGSLVMNINNFEILPHSDYRFRIIESFFKYNSEHNLLDIYFPDNGDAEEEEYNKISNANELYLKLNKKIGILVLEGKTIDFYSRNNGLDQYNEAFHDSLIFDYYSIFDLGSLFPTPPGWTPAPLYPEDEDNDAYSAREKIWVEDWPKYNKRGFNNISKFSTYKLLRDESNLNAESNYIMKNNIEYAGVVETLIINSDVDHICKDFLKPLFNLQTIIIESETLSKLGINNFPSNVKFITDPIEIHRNRKDFPFVSVLNKHQYALYLSICYLIQKANNEVLVEEYQSEITDFSYRPSMIFYLEKFSINNEIRPSIKMTFEHTINIHVPPHVIDTLKPRIVKEIELLDNEGIIKLFIENIVDGNFLLNLFKESLKTCFISK